MTKNERMFPDDDVFEEIYDAHMDVVAISKGYFCMLFGHHDSLEVAVSIFIDGGPDTLRSIANLIALQATSSDLPAELNDGLRELLLQPYFGKPPGKSVTAIRSALLMSCGLSVACFESLEEGKRSAAITAYGKTEFYLAMCSATGQATFGIDSASANATLGAMAKLANDPRQKDKALVRECWEIWQAFPQRTRRIADFARDMLEKFESLKSQPVIEGWCRIWEREMPTQQAE